jgi:hypothetical protein
MRKMPSSIGGKRDGDDLLLRMHFLRKMCRCDEKCLPKLRRRISAPASAEINSRNTQEHSREPASQNKRQDRPRRGVSVLECFVAKALMLFDKVQAV